MDNSSNKALRALRDYAEGREIEAPTPNRQAAEFAFGLLEKVYGEEAAYEIVYEMADLALLPGFRGMLDNDE